MFFCCKVQGPVVQIIVSLSSLVVKMLIVLVSTISNSQVFLLKKCESYSHFFSKNINIYAIFNDQSFNDMSTKETSLVLNNRAQIFFLFLHKNVFVSTH